MENLLSLVNSSDIELSSDSKFWVVFPHNFFPKKPIDSFLLDLRIHLPYYLKAPFIWFFSYVIFHV